MNKPRVAHIAVYPAQGASHSAEQDLSALAGYLKSLLGGLPRDERKYHIVLTNLKSDKPASFEDEGMSVHECWKKGSLGFAWTLFQKIRALPECGVVHLQHEFNQFGGAMTLPFNLLLLAALRLGLRRKLVVTFHEVLQVEQLTREFLDSACISYPAWLVRLLVSFYYRSIGRIAHVLIAQDEVFADVLRHQHHAVAPVEIVRIGTEVAQPLPREIARRRWQIAADDRVVLFFGTIDRRKGLDLLLDAWELLPQERLRLIIAGGAPVRVKHTSDYQNWRGNLDARMAANPTLLPIGFVSDEDLPALFGASDLVVLPYTVPQRVSAVFNQAASFGIPLIASTAFEGQADPLMLFDPSPQALAQKLQDALEEKKLNSLRLASEDFRNQHSWKNSAKNLTRIYKSMLDEYPA